MEAVVGHLEVNDHGTHDGLHVKHHSNILIADGAPGGGAAADADPGVRLAGHQDVRLMQGRPRPQQTGLRHE